MIIFITIIHVIVCLVLILVILLQAGRGQGLTGASFGTGNVQSLFGTGAADFLTKATTVCAILFLFTSIGLGYVESHRAKSLLKFSKNQAPIDVDSIKKALERIKQEDVKKGDAVKDAVQKADEAVSNAQKTVSETAKNSEAAKTLTAQADQAQQAVQETATDTQPEKV